MVMGGGCWAGWAVGAGGWAGGGDWQRLTTLRACDAGRGGNVFRRARTDSIVRGPVDTSTSMMHSEEASSIRVPSFSLRTGNRKSSARSCAERSRRDTGAVSSVAPSFAPAAL